MVSLLAPGVDLTNIILGNFHLCVCHHSIHTSKLKEDSLVHMCICCVSSVFMVSESCLIAPSHVSGWLPFYLYNRC